VQAFNTVAGKTRVDGQITSVFFTEGQDVKAGDQLFQIDPRPFQAALAQAEANQQKDQAQLQEFSRRRPRLLPAPEMPAE
jgi:multidrug efflux system membrane fusion protein